MSDNIFDKVVDAVDVETVVLCNSEAEAKGIGMALLKELGFRDGDVVSVEFTGMSARLRLRGNVFKPGDHYTWEKQFKEFVVLCNLSVVQNGGWSIMSKNDFENLKTYQLAENLADEIWNVILARDGFARDTVGRQIVRFADSIGANIAEGSGRQRQTD